MKKLILTAQIAMTLTSCSSQQPQQEQNVPRQIDICISSHFSAPDKKAIAIAISSWLLRQGGCNARLMDGWNCQTIAEFEVPKVTYFKESAVARKIGRPFDNWTAWVREQKSDPILEGTGAVNVPQLLTRLAQENAKVEFLVIIGSPVARFPGQTNYDFAEPFLRYPGTGQITRDPFSPFASLGLEQSLNGTKIVFLYPRIDTSSWPAGYEQKLHQFYGAFLEKRGGNLLAFSPNLEGGLKLLNSERTLATEKFPINSAEIAMIDARPPVQVAASNSPPRVASATAGKAPSPTESRRNRVQQPEPRIITPNPAPSGAPSHVDVAAPSTVAPIPNVPMVVTVSNVTTVTNITVITTQVVREVRAELPEKGVTLQLRYPRNLNADIDLFVRPHAGADEISYANSKTSIGSYDYDSISAENVKSIHLPAGCDPAKTVAWVNYRRGFGRVTARIVWLTPSNSREMGIAFFADRGGDGNHRTEFFRKRSDCWLKVNLPALLSAPAVPLQGASSNPPAHHHVRPLSGEAGKPSTATGN